MNRQNVIIVDNSVHWTGALRSILNFATFLKDNFEFTLILPAPSSRRSKIEISYRVIPFLELKRNLTVLLYLPMLLINSVRILKLVRNSQAIVHVNDLYNMCGVVIKMIRPKTRVIYHVRLLPSSYVKSLYRVWQYFILKFTDEIICVSKAVASHWPQKKNIHVIYDAIESEESLPIRVIDNSKTISFLYLANYIQGKGHDVALLAFNEVYRVNPNVRLRMVGGDMGLTKNQEFKNGLIRFVEEHKLNDVVSIDGFSEHVEALMKQADIFLNFSESESFSMTCLEALYYGTPCIATRSGGPLEIIENDISGLLVPVGDVSRMIEAMIHLAADVEKRKLFSANGRLRARSVFSIQTQAVKLATLYASN